MMVLWNITSTIIVIFDIIASLRASSCRKLIFFYVWFKKSIAIIFPCFYSIYYYVCGFKICIQLFGRTETINYREMNKAMPLFLSKCYEINPLRYKILDLTTIRTSIFHFRFMSNEAFTISQTKQHFIYLFR